ncbi:MAG: FAD-dependent thymidylate synthase [bacterium]
MPNKNKILQYYFTNTEDNVYAIKPTLSPQVSAAIISRCSRTNKPLRELFLEEFLKDSGLVISENLDDNIVDPEAQEKAAVFFDRVLAQFGDESIGEVANATIIIENASPIAIKVIESMRRMAFIEVSTRYVDFRTKYKDNYRYYVDNKVEEIIGSEYRSQADKLFDTYSKWFDQVKNYVLQNNPKLDDEKDMAYNGAVHARTCDILRELLPFGIIANVGISGNGRDWSDLVNIMRSHPLEEVRELGEKIIIEVGKIIPNIIKRASGPHGEKIIQYMAEVNTIVENASLSVEKEFKVSKKSRRKTNEMYVKILSKSDNLLEKLCAGIVYNDLGVSFDKLVKYFKNNQKETESLLNKLTEIRTNRFEKAHEGMEYGKISVEMYGPISAWKDLQRHRRMSQQRSKYFINEGFYVADEIYEMGLDKKYKKLVNETMDFIEEMKCKYPELSDGLDYLVPLGANVKWVMDMDIAEAIYMLELRSSSGGHITYRKLMHLFYKELEILDPRISKLAKNTDLNMYYLGRRESFNKVVKKGGILEWM